MGFSTKAGAAGDGASAANIGDVESTIVMSKVIRYFIAISISVDIRKWMACAAEHVANSTGVTLRNNFKPLTQFRAGRTQEEIGVISFYTDAIRVGKLQ